MALQLGYTIRFGHCKYLHTQQAVSAAHSDRPTAAATHLREVLNCQLRDFTRVQVFEQLEESIVRHVIQCEFVPAKRDGEHTVRARAVSGMSRATVE